MMDGWKDGWKNTEMRIIHNNYDDDDERDLRVGSKTEGSNLFFVFGTGSLSRTEKFGGGEVSAR